MKEKAYTEERRYEKMLDKRKELENLENKYREIKKLNSEISSIISDIKNDVEISREKELLEEKERLEKKLKLISQKLNSREKEIEDLKKNNSVLLEELKETKKLKRNTEIEKFKAFISEKIDVDLESGIIKKLSSFSKEMTVKIKNTDKSISDFFSKEAEGLKSELNELSIKVNSFSKGVENIVSREKTLLNEESSIFHNKIKEEIQIKSDSFLFEKEKTKFMFEKLIGLRGFNFFGIISIFLGVFLIFRTQFARILSNDYVKSIFSYVLGLIFLFGGEKLYHKNKKPFSVGLIGGGIGIMYLTTLLSTMYLKLFPMMTGLLISLILTALAILLSLRYNSQIIGILSLIGGYVPYAAYIWVNKSNVQIYYIAAYSLILQGTVLGISWKKDWLYNKITGFIFGIVNMTGLVYYLNYILNDKITAFIYILILTTAYSFIFLNSPKKENRDDGFFDYIFLSLNLIIKFSLIYTLFDEKSPIWLKAGLIIIVGTVYGFLGDRLKENRISRIFYYVALISFILIIPVTVPKTYIAVAWGLEALILYILYRKYNSTEIKYGAVSVYIISMISGLSMRENQYMAYIQDLMIIFYSFALYAMLKRKNYKDGIEILTYIFKYGIFLYTILFINRIIFDAAALLKIYDDIRTWLSIILITVFILRYVTYKVREFRDRFSLHFLVSIEILGLMFTNLINFLIVRPYNVEKSAYYINADYLFVITLLIAVNVFMFAAVRNDLHLLIFRKTEKHPLWLLGEAFYILAVSHIIMTESMYLENSGIYLNMAGLILCGYFVWKGFKIPNRSVRRTGLGIGIFFTVKSFFLDFPLFESSYRIIAYFITGGILIGTSYIYQSALKKLDYTGKKMTGGNSEEVLDNGYTEAEENENENGNKGENDEKS